MNIKNQENGRYKEKNTEYWMKGSKIQRTTIIRSETEI